jgi:hypothetical protein
MSDRQFLTGSSPTVNFDRSPTVNFERSPTVNVDRLKPYFARAADLSPPGHSTDAGQEGKHEVEPLLNRGTMRGVSRR